MTFFFNFPNFLDIPQLAVKKRIIIREKKEKKKKKVTIRSTVTTTHYAVETDGPAKKLWLS